MSNFDFAVKHTLEAEGLFVNHPNDPGGKTKYGVTERMWTEYWAEEFGQTDTPCPAIETITRAHAIAFFKDVFWDALRLDRVKNKYIAAEIFDSAVNMGAGDAVKFLQRAINFCRLPGWGQIKVDGALGPVTRNAADRLANEGHIIPLIKAMNGFQFAHYVGEDNPHMSRGWMRRINIPSELA